MSGRKNREKIEIMANIMKLSVSGTIKRSHIMYGANLSHEQTLHYLEELQCKGLLEERMEKGTPVYRITEKGGEFLNLFTNISSMMNST